MVWVARKIDIAFFPTSINMKQNNGFRKYSRKTNSDKMV